MTLLLLDFGSRASKAITAAVEAAKKDKAATVATLATLVAASTKGWDPKVGGRVILTPELRDLLAKALGHLAFNIAAAETGRPRV